MKKHGVLIGATFITASALFYLCSSLTPAVSGRSTSQWIHELDDDDVEKQKAAISALIMLGPDGRSIPKLAEILLSGDEQLRQKALIALMQSTARSAAEVQPIIEVMREGDVVVRRGCAMVLGTMKAGFPNVVSCLTEGMEDVDIGVRRECAIGLGRLGASAATAIPLLVIACAHEEPTMRSTAARALGEIGPDAFTAIPVLLKLMTGLLEPDFIRIQAARALGRIGPESAEVRDALLGGLRFTRGPVRRAVAEAIGDLRPPPVRQLVDLLHGDEVATGAVAATALGSLGRRAVSSIPELVKAFDSKHHLVRTKSAMALGKLGPPGLAQLSQCMSENKYAALAARGLVSAGRSSIPALVELLQSADVTVAMHAANTLKVFGKDGAVAGPELFRVMKSGQEPAASAAAMAIAAVGADVMQIADLLKDDRVSIQLLACVTLQEYRSRGAPVAPDVMKLLNSSHAEVRDKAAATLAVIGTQSSDLPALKGFLSHGSPTERLGAALAIVGAKLPYALELVEQPLTLILEEGDTEMKSRAVKAFADLGVRSQNAAVAISALLSDEDAELRRLSVRCLASVGEADHAIPKLTAALDDPSPAVRQTSLMSLQAFADRGELIMPVLEKAYRGTDSELRVLALRILQRLGRKLKDLPWLIEALKHPDTQTRVAAWSAARRLSVEWPQFREVAIGALKDEESRVRHSAIRMIMDRSHGDQAAFDAVFALHRDPSERIRSLTLSYLDRLNLAPQVRRSILLDALQSTDNATVQAVLEQYRVSPELGRIPPDILTRLLSQEHFHIRLMAAEQLGRWGSDATEAVPALRGLFSDSFMQVRRAAEKALKKIEGC